MTDIWSPEGRRRPQVSNAGRERERLKMVKKQKSYFNLLSVPWNLPIDHLVGLTRGCNSDHATPLLNLCSAGVKGLLDLLVICCRGVIVGPDPFS